VTKSSWDQTPNLKHWISPRGRVEAAGNFCAGSVRYKSYGRMGGAPLETLKSQNGREDNTPYGFPEPDASLKSPAEKRRPHQNNMGRGIGFKDLLSGTDLSESKEERAKPYLSCLGVQKIGLLEWSLLKDKLHGTRPRGCR